jgi:hypothetical protein
MIAYIDNKDRDGKQITTMALKATEGVAGLCLGKYRDKHSNDVQKTS